MKITHALTLMLLLITASCEAAVLDPNGNSIKTSDAISPQIQGSNNVVQIKDLNVKGVIPYIDMETGKVTYNKNELTGHDISIEVDFSVFQVYVKLGEDYSTGIETQALNSMVKDFHAIDTSPETGHLTDSENHGLVIGNKFYDGGNGWSGFQMTKNVYLFKTRNGKFAKLQFLKAKQGNIDLQYFIQQDSSTNLKTSAKE